MIHLLSSFQAWSLEKKVKTMVLGVCVLLILMIWLPNIRFLLKRREGEPPANVPSPYSSPSGAGGALQPSLRPSTSLRVVGLSNHVPSESRGREEEDHLSVADRKIPRSAYPDWGADPFRLERAADLSELYLEGIVQDRDSSVAVINGEIYREGERVGNAVLTSIQRDRVILEGEGGRKKELVLFEK